MARSAVAKGSYYKARTKRWLEGEGYQVAFLERMMLLHIPEKLADDGTLREAARQLPIKRDQFGSDLLAVRRDAVVFVQVKLGRKDVWDALREFARYEWPDTPAVKRWVVCWEKGAKTPEVVDAAATPLRTGDVVPREFADAALASSRTARPRRRRTTLF